MLSLSKLSLVKEFKQTVRNAFDVYFDTARTLLELIAIGLGFEMAEFDKERERLSTAIIFNMAHIIWGEYIYYRELLRVLLTNLSQTD